MKKFYSQLILAALLLSLVSCGNTTGTTEATDTAAADTTPIETAPETAYLDALPVEDFQGYTYRMVAQHTDARPNFAASDEITGEALQDAIVQRKQSTMERLNIDIEEIGYENRGTLHTDVAKTIRAGDDAYDIIITSLSDGINHLTTQSCLLDLTTLPHVTLDSERWNLSMAENMRIDGKQYFTTGVTSVCYLYTPQAVIFNKQIAAENSLPDLYETVLEGKWTVDFMGEMMKDAAIDLNGDGKMTAKEDRWAFLVEGNYGGALYMAGGFQSVSPDQEGNWGFHLTDAASVDFIDKCAAIFYDEASIYTDENAADQPLYHAIFTEGRALFTTFYIKAATDYREMETDFGVLPIPVLREGDPYLVACNTWLPSGIAVPVTCQDPARTGLIMETMAAYSYDQVLPAIIEKTLGKTARDEQSYQIMMLMYENTAYDFNTIMDFGGTSALLRGAVIGARDNFVSSYEKIQTKAETALAEFIASCREE